MTRYLENTHHSGQRKLGNPPPGWTEAQRLQSLSWTEVTEQTRSGERGRSWDARPPLSFPPGKDDSRSRDPDWGRFPRQPWTTSPRPPGTRPVTEEILPDTSETISGSERGEEGNPWSGCGIRPLEQTAPRIWLQEPARASNALTGNPYPQQRWNPVRRTPTRHPGVCDRSRQRPSKRATYLCAPAAADPAG